MIDDFALTLYPQSDGFDRGIRQALRAYARAFNALIPPPSMQSKAQQRAERNRLRMSLPAHRR